MSSFSTTLDSVLLHLFAIIVLLPLLLSVAVVNLILRTLLTLYLFGPSQCTSVQHSLASGLDNLPSTSGPDSQDILVFILTPFQKSDLDIALERDNFSATFFPRVNHDNDAEKLKYFWTSKWGYGCWEKKTAAFNLSHHVKFGPELDAADLFSSILSLLEPWEPGRPQWEWILVPNMLQGKTARLFRIHPSYMHPQSALNLIQRFLEPGRTTTSSRHSNQFLDRVTWSWSWLQIPVMISKQLLQKRSQLQDPFRCPRYKGQTYLASSQPRSLTSNLDPSFLETALKTSLTNILTRNQSNFGPGFRINLEIPVALPSSKWLSNRVSFVDHSFTPGVAGSGHSSTEIQTLTENVSTVFCSWAGTLPLSLLRHLLSPNKCQNSTYFNFVEMNANLANIPEIFVSSGLRRPTGLGVTVVKMRSQLNICGIAEAGCVARDVLQEIVDGMTNWIESHSD